MKEPVTSTAFLPFIFVTRFDVMMTDVMEKFASHALFAALLATCWVRACACRISHSPGSRNHGGRSGIRTDVHPGSLLPSAALTTLSDPLVAAAGCMIGAVLRQHVLSFLNFSATHDFIGPQDTQTLAASEHRHTLSDGLIVSLTDPDENAPVEPAPTHRRAYALAMSQVPSGPTHQPLSHRRAQSYNPGWTDDYTDPFA